jgi:outer membrane protein OmpA-like peptidoglycan-associated protein
MMRKNKRSLQSVNSTEKAVLYLAFELSKTKWKLAFSDRKKIGFVTIASRDLVQLNAAIKKAKLHFSLSNDVRIVSCCEAGRDGFWLHRYLGGCGIKNIVVDVSNIKINQRKQRAKTDRIDAAQLLKRLIRYYGGEKKAMSVVRVPGSVGEDGRNLNQKLEALKKEQTTHRVEALNKEQTAHRSRLRGFYLIRQGLKELATDKRFGFLAVVILLLIFSGYLILNLKLPDSLRWGLEDIAPKEYESPVLKAKESFEPGFTDEKKVNEELQIVEKDDNINVANLDMQTNSQVNVGHQKDDYSEEQSTMLIPDRKIVVYFNHESNELPNHAFKTLDQIIQFSAHYPESKIVVEGYTDSFDKDLNNRKLSKIKADVVKKYLVSRGIPATNIKTFGMGSEKPITSNETVEGSKQSHRVEIKLNKK